LGLEADGVGLSLSDTASGDLRKEVLERLGIPNAIEMVVSAGRLSPEKGHQFLIEAIGMLQGSSNKTHFVFCGDGPCHNDLEKRSKELGISGICHFVGFRRDLKEIFQAMDLMVLPSLTEGLPNVVLEAFACAKPVVATDVGGVPEIVEDGVNGILVPPERSDLLGEALKNFLATPEKRRMMGEAGYQKVKSEFTFESQTQKLEAIYNEVLKEF
jgi:glycosyltransferase involved in cell wall biosynthesis